MISDRYFDPPEDEPEDDTVPLVYEPDFEAMVEKDGPVEDRDCDYWNKVT